MVWVLAAQAAPEPCAPQRVDARERVRWVLDGDTLETGSDERVRLIGINAPEMGRDAEPAQPLARESRRTLQDLIDGSGGRVSLQYGRETRDRYGRRLAHIFASDGSSINAALLAAGMGTWLVVPPNLGLSDCYRRAETEARTQGRGVWGLDAYRAVPVETLRPGSTGYRRVSGRVTRIGRGRGAVYVNLGPRLGLKVVDDDLTYFRDVDFDDWVGRELVAGGWLSHSRGRFKMRVRHPAALEFPGSHPRASQ